MQLIFISGSLRRGSLKVAGLTGFCNTFTQTFVLFPHIDSSLVKYELLCYATSTGNISVQDLTKYKAVLALLQVDGAIYSNLLIPLSLFKTMTSGRCNYYESTGVYKCDFKYVDDTTINVLSLSNSTRCYFYGI